MRIRTGFVSNSSSASFVVTWKVLDLHVKDEDAINYAVAQLLDYNSEYDPEEPFNEIVKNTKVLSLEDHIFKTGFWTCMMNSSQDFGDAAKSFVMALHCKEFYQEPGTTMIKHLRSEIETDN